jgi:hypothetical protein
VTRQVTDRLRLVLDGPRCQSSKAKAPLTLLTSEIVIEAPSEVVSQVPVDFDSYSDWTLVEIEARGEAVVGAAFTHAGKLPGQKPRTFKAKIIEATPARAAGVKKGASWFRDCSTFATIRDRSAG